jgi:hypothetical protein
MKKYLTFFTNPILFMELLYSKPKILIPSILAALIPLITYQDLNDKLSYLDTKWIVLILVLISILSVFFFFITSFIIYLLLSIVLIESESNITFKKVYSIYGYTQFPKFILALIIALFPSLHILSVNSSSSFLTSILYFFTNPLMIWKYILLVSGFYVLTRTRMKILVILAVFFAIAEVGLNYLISSQISLNLMN